jgi:DNA-directed RNA polymerase specialized sigma24 family protein
VPIDEGLIHQQIGSVMRVTCGNFRSRHAKRRNECSREVQEGTDFAG